MNVTYSPDPHHPLMTSDILPACEKWGIGVEFVPTVAGLINVGHSVEDSCKLVSQLIKDGTLTLRPPSQFTPERMALIAQECYRRTNPEKLYGLFDW